MPHLRYTNNQNKTVLEFIFTLTELEKYGSTSEGWLHYTLTINRAGSEFAKVDGNIHSIDVVAIEKVLEKRSKHIMEIIPLEPDFILQSVDTRGSKRISIQINSGVLQGVYDNAYIGVSFEIDTSDRLRFVDELRKSRLELTKGIHFKNFDAREAPS